MKRKGIILYLLFILIWVPLYPINAQNQIIRQKHQSSKSKNQRNRTISNKIPSAPITTESIMINGEKIEMVIVEGGDFIMGTNKKLLPVNDDYLNGYPAHKEHVNTFKICKYVVTEKLWKSVMGNNPKSSLGDNYPVQCSWDEANEFISKLNSLTGEKFRLPSEKEWEFAARGGIHSKGYKYSGGNNIHEVGWEGGDGYKPVGKKKPNELGLYDMSGNIFEWCNEFVEGTDHMVLKGGSWDFGAESALPSSRQHSSNYYSLYCGFGFRLAMDVNENIQKIEANNNKIESHSNRIQIIQNNNSYQITDSTKAFEIGKNYELGINGYKKSPQDAIYWFEKASKGNHAEAQANLGIIYFYGINVPKDKQKGITYMKLAIKNGYKHGEKYLNEMTSNQEVP